MSFGGVDCPRCSCLGCCCGSLELVSHHNSLLERQLWGVSVKLNLLLEIGCTEEPVFSFPQ